MQSLRNPPRSALPAAPRPAAPVASSPTSPATPRARASPVRRYACPVRGDARSGCRRSCATPARAGLPPSTGCCRAPPTPAPTREAARGKQSGRTQEIQRLIGRALRAVTPRGARRASVILDCDVSRPMAARAPRRSPAPMSRCTSALSKLVAAGAARAPLTPAVAAVSCGVVGGTARLDSTMPRTAVPKPTPTSCCPASGAWSRSRRPRRTCQMGSDAVRGHARRWRAAASPRWWSPSARRWDAGAGAAAGGRHP